MESTDLGEDLVEVSNLRETLPLVRYLRLVKSRRNPHVLSDPTDRSEDIFLGSLEILLLEGWMLEEIRTFDDHGSPRVQNPFDVTLAIHGCLILPPSVFESNPCRVLGNCLQAAKLPHQSRREICGGPRMAYEWDSVKIRTPKGRGSGWHPRGSPLKAPRCEDLCTPSRRETKAGRVVRRLGSIIPWVTAVRPMRVLYSSIVGASSVPWMLKTAWIGSQNATAAPRKFQSTR
ncbi:hypothetical protein CRG98_044248 [Punica granatum]|uniref:Uncharacterized protein n=1 Tax=Punica granatum TaxID=22663 RepID=A0A2I0HUI7_PUNGR|nr:hypothetical protein CRG98_044248 [Punica granatum]